MSFKYKELGECIDLIIDNRGKTPKKMGSDWVEKGIKTISAKNVHNGKLDNYESIRFVNSEVYKKWMKDDIKKGDCLLVSEGATLGENLYWDLDEKVVIGQRLYCIRTNEEILNSKYFSAYLNTVEYQKEIEGRSTGTSVLGIRQTELLKTKVLIMDMEEQKFIGNLYYDINLKIEVNNKINKNLEEMAQAIFKQWFVDFEFPNEEGKPYKSSGGEMVESELGMIPKDFNVISIYDVANIIYGAPFKSKLFNEDKKGLPLIRIRDLKSGTPNFYTEEEHSKATIVKTGDILVGMDAEFTPTIWHGETGYLNQRVCMFKSKISYISDYFLYESIKPYMKFMESAKVGTTVIHLGKSDIDKLTIILPSIDIIKRFSEISNSILVKMINIYNENRNLNKLRDTLLPKLMSGEIRVPLENSEN